jgi:hypothetical protein
LFDAVVNAVFNALAGILAGFLVADLVAAGLTGFFAATLDGALAARLADFTAVLRPLVSADFRLAPFDPAANLVLDTLTDAVFEDFLCVFLDIRLPFVAFGGSVFRALQVLPGQAGQRALALCNSADLGVWLEGIRRNPSRFAECAPGLGKEIEAASGLKV